MSNESTVMTDDVAVKALEAEKTRWTRFRDMRVTADADTKRLTGEQTAALAEAKENFGSDKLDDIRQIVVDGRKKNETNITAFRETMDGIEAKLAQITEAPSA